VDILIHAIKCSSASSSYFCLKDVLPVKCHVGIWGPGIWGPGMLFYSFYTSAIGQGEWQLRLTRFTSRQSPGTHFTVGCLGPMICLDECREQNIFLNPHPIEPQTDQRLDILYVCLKSKYSPPCFINRLTLNDTYMGRTAALTSKRCILYIYSTNVGTEYFKHALYSPFFLFKMQFVP
jgi:hypothetical protein